MTARIIDEVAIAAEIRADIKARVARISERGIDPGLAFVIVGDNPAFEGGSGTFDATPWETTHAALGTFPIIS